MKAPGVYLEEIFLKPEIILPTGVPGFVGFATANKPENQKDGVVQLYRKQELDDKLNFPEDGYLKASVIGFFDNGGTRCYIAFADPNIAKQEALKNAIKALAPITDIDLMAFPDAMKPLTKDAVLDEKAVLDMQRSLIQDCTDQGDRFAILDSLPGKTSESVLTQCNAIKENQSQQKPVNGSLYYPWLQNAQGRWVPPCGHIAGIFARSDRARGVFKAPANEEIRDAVNLQVLIDNSDQGGLNAQGINCLLAFPGRGIRVWGARTLSSDSNWRYINVRRLFITIKRWIDLNMLWAAFEPNTPQLWVRIQRELSGYLTQLWRAGALKGETPEQAFYVKCDAEINPPASREIGNVFTEIGFAPSSPAEFIFVRITHRANTTEIS
ncbi:phage tail sheath family protein [Tolypothrix sp. FACHB-123]|uniref:phage tail sheath family protein n=1 Tax=Tolypothrix sp. FACHB-123 TaxID=2692868 RepID=UPI001688BF1B|nr:phage tail sheath subtilisin-like domain-containing protein [Tolypothrix sp. FACHB-123]MBD2358702.1 phage tail sheath family protein [Tolypothrix sp. FACHB-123]